MEKETYNVDDILSEVKRHREKEQQNLENAAHDSESGEAPAKQNGETAQGNEANQDGETQTNEETEPQPETPDEPNAPEDEIFSITEESVDENRQESASDEEDAAPEAEEAAQTPEPEADADSADNADGGNEPDGGEAQAENTDENGTEDYSDDFPGALEEEAQDERAQVPEGYVDLLEIANDDESESEAEAEDEPTEKAAPKKKKRLSKKSKKIIITVVVILLCALIAAGIYLYVYINDALNQVTDNDGGSTQTEEEWAGMDDFYENFPSITEAEASTVSSLQDMIKQWYYNGAPCSSTHVLNVLLVGEDTRGDEILDEDTRADAAIIVSVNIDTQEITLTSVLRDAYAYYEDTSDSSTDSTTDSSDSTDSSEIGRFGKINGAMKSSGISGYIDCVESLYKIDIDNYVIVNFTSFESIIDEIGGVSLELTSAEINEINNNPDRYGDVYIEKTFDGDSGVMELDGSQALAYCRIREIDSDNVRANRQKTCLYEIFNKVKESSTVTQLKVVNALIPYVKTGFSSDEIVSIAKYALSQGWLDYDINMLTVPYARINEKGAGGTYYGAWCWKADYPQDAYYLQTMLYGKSSITLAQSRVDILNCNLYGFYEDSLTPCYATLTNYNYGEVTTYASEEDETTTSN